MKRPQPTETAKLGFETPNSRSTANVRLPQPAIPFSLA